jgi:hydrogenase maturation protein HypF
VVYLNYAFGNDALNLKIDFTKRVEAEKWKTIVKMVEKGINSPLTSSMGRLFDAVSSILSIRDEVNYEGQAAIELEMIATHENVGEYKFQIFKEEKPMIIDPKEIIIGIVFDLLEGIPLAKVSSKFHRTIARIIIETCKLIRFKEELNRVALSGGVFQNIFLLSLVKDGLRNSGFEIFTHHTVPTNDGGISLGQAVIAFMCLFHMRE